MPNAYGAEAMAFVLQPSIQAPHQQKQKSVPCYPPALGPVTNSSQEALKSSHVSGTQFSSTSVSRLSREEDRQLETIGPVGFSDFLHSVRGPRALHNRVAGVFLSTNTQHSLKVASRSGVDLRNRFCVSCSARGSSSSNPSSVDSPAVSRNGGGLSKKGGAPIISRRPQTILQFPELTESDRSTSNIWKGNRRSLDEDPWVTSDNGLHDQQGDSEHERSLQCAEAGGSQSQVLQSQQQEDDVMVQTDSGDMFVTVGDKLNSVKDPGLTNEAGSIAWNGEGIHGTHKQNMRTGALNILARDVDIIREGIGWMKQVLLLDRKQPKAGVLMNKTLSADKDWHEVVQESTETLHPRETGESSLLARDVAVKDAQVIFPTIKEVNARFPTTMLTDADNGHLGSEFRSQNTSALPMVKEGVTYLHGVMDGLIQAFEPLLKRIETIGNRTGVDKAFVRNLQGIEGGISLVKKNIKDVVHMRRWEDSSAVAEAPPAWPQPSYYGLSGKDLLRADMDALMSYGTYMRGFFKTWQIPLQLAYDPEAVASYFNRRPHLLIFRLVEVSAAFSGVALQHILEKTSLRSGKSGSVGKNVNQSTVRSAEALKHSLLRLGPTFIKVAQSLSSRPDIIGIDTAKVLSELQDRLPPFSTDDAMAVIEEELGVPLSEVFASLSKEPVAAASFGQVYKGLTVEGAEVAVKVQRPDLLFTVARDVYVLRLGLGILRKLAKMNSDISVLADEVGRGLFGELDYTLEAANAQEFEALHKHLSYVKVPRILSYLTRRRVLTMEWIDGERPLDLKLIAEGSDLAGGLASMTQRQEAKRSLDALVRKGVECSLVQLLETGLMHADPHPGNLLYNTREGILAYLDFGLLTRVNKKHQAAMLAVIAHLVNGEWQCLANDFADLDILKPSTDRFALRLALERAFGEGPDAVVRNGVPDIQFGQVTGKLWKVALKFRFRLPAYYTLVLRSLASLEGIAVSVDPDYKVFAAAYPYVLRRLFKDNSRPSRQVLRSLVLTQKKKEFRWDRIAAIMATSRQGSPEKVGQATGHLQTLNLGDLASEEMPKGKDSTLSLLSFTLSKEGTPLRRVLLEADTKSLAEAFVSAPARTLRRKVSCALAEIFYLNILTFTDMEPEWSSTATGAGHGTRRMTNSMTNTTVVSTSERSQTEVLPGALNTEKENLLQPSSDLTLKNQRLWFLLKVLATRLRSTPIVMLRASWAVVTIVGFAAALAAHKYAITLTDRLLSAESKEASNRSQRPVDRDSNAQVQVGSVYASAV